MDLIPAAKCKYCSKFHEPKTGFVIKNAHINRFNGAIDKQVTVVILTEETYFCTVECLNNYISMELNR